MLYRSMHATGGYRRIPRMGFCVSVPSAETEDHWLPVDDHIVGFSVRCTRKRIRFRSITN